MKSSASLKNAVQSFIALVHQLIEKNEKNIFICFDSFSFGKLSEENC